MPVTATYRAEVAIPDKVWECYHNTAAYSLKQHLYSKGSKRLGFAYFPQLVEWADFATERDAQDFCAAWHNAILKWESELRSEP